VSALFPLFLKLEGRPVVLVGGGRVATTKAQALLEAGAQLTVVAPQISPALERPGVRLVRRAFEPLDLDGAWLVVAAAPAQVNRAVAQAAEERRIFVNAVDHPDTATAYTGGVLKKGGATVAVSTEGVAPALAGLLREGLEAVLPDELGEWIALATHLRAEWRARGVPMSQRRPELLEALNRSYARKALVPSASGFVSLVGAGPGDPDLLTLKAVDRLRAADLVLYDALISPEVLKMAGKAQRFFVGKRAGRKSIEQRTIEKLMIRAASRGKRVVRLKAGDPFVLGRGGEEALALAAAGVPFEVVPGISSAVAAAASVGIPVTHRGLSAGFTVVSGHSEAAYRPVLSSLQPGASTVVVLMGVGERAGISSAMLGAGWSASTPAAIVMGASTADEWAWFGTLAGLRAVEVPPSLPGVLIVGEVVTVSEKLHLHGQTKEKQSVHG
jgi:uroporphyrin-III C-methyltransferase/precorrin-2 dehydrogenase/sirohydrochlorin ferrochelatase